MTAVPQLPSSVAAVRNIRLAPKLASKINPLDYCVRKLLALCDDDEIKPSIRDVLTQFPFAAALVAGCHFHSPFLRRLMQQNPQWLHASLMGEPARHLACLVDGLAQAGKGKSVDGAMRALRQARNRIALHVALMDCGGIWMVEQVTDALTLTADTAVRVALEIALRKASDAERIKFCDAIDTSDTDRYAERSGITIIAMGKHGAFELNYSSDIDLIALFDPELVPVAEGQDCQTVCVRIIQDIVRLLDQRTADGHVFRVDLRLRPDPASTPVAISLGAAFSYYESVGQNWERAAMIKARAVAGNIAIGDTFLQELAPFVWRKYFDYAAIADIHAMKRQIYVHKGHETIAIEGHDIKLGRGGIREIEFFVQTQQLIYGGRRPHLRQSRTLDMLQALQSDGWINQQAVSDLSAAYRFLRTTEHRLQMVNDEQTQRLPLEKADLDQFAAFCGMTAIVFRKTLLIHLKNVEHHYARLFEDSGDLASKAGSLVFTGTDDDPETIATLERLGFSNPALAAETIRGWHFGRRKAVTTARARENLTELVPKLLVAFGKSTDPDTALGAFDDALSRMPAAVELFAILKQNKALLELFAELLGNAPRLADIVAKRPHVLDSLLDPDFTQASDSKVVKSRIDNLLARAAGFEDFLNQARELAYSERFLIGARVLSRLVDPLNAGPAHTMVAEAFVEQALREVTSEIEARYGRIKDGRMIVLGLGKLGGREMTAASDLDLIIVFDAPADSASSGARSLSPSEYYARITQRLVTALSSPMTRGVLYEIDLRLRPSGRKGPVAVSIKGFADYHANEAETWEHMALTRARPVAGDASLSVEVALLISGIIGNQRLAADLQRSILDMRKLVAHEKGDNKSFDLKLAKGGLLDIEFAAQYIILANAHHFPQICHTNTGKMLEAAIDLSLIPRTDGLQLLEAWKFYSCFEQVLRICMEEKFEPTETRPKMRRWLANILDFPDFSVLESHLKNSQTEVRRIFQRLVSTEEQ